MKECERSMKIKTPAVALREYLMAMRGSSVVLIGANSAARWAGIFRGKVVRLIR